MALTPSSEMYLKTILAACEEAGGAHVQEIARRLDVRMPSVTQALQRLTEQKYVIHTPRGAVKLTARGLRIARAVKDRHRVLEEFLTRVLQVAPAAASRDACAMEHVVSALTLSRLTEFLDFLHTCPLGASDAIAHFADFSRARATGSACPECEPPPGTGATKARSVQRTAVASRARPGSTRARATESGAHGSAVAADAAPTPPLRRTRAR